MKVAAPKRSTTVLALTLGYFGGERSLAEMDTDPAILPAIEQEIMQLVSTLTSVLERSIRPAKMQRRQHVGMVVSFGCPNDLLAFFPFWTLPPSGGVVGDRGQISFEALTRWFGEINELD